MPKSINTPSKNAQINAQAPFKAGDAVLCPTLGNDSYQLFIDDKNGLLSFIAGVNKYHVQADGKQSPNDKSPLIFHNTPANRQAVNTLFGTDIAAPLVIDTTASDDQEIIMLSAFRMTNLADDIKQAADTLDDIGKVLGLIHYETVEGFTARSLARLAHESADTWSELLYCSLDKINNTLAKTSYGKVGE